MWFWLNVFQQIQKNDILKKQELEEKKINERDFSSSFFKPNVTFGQGFMAHTEVRQKSV
jgi:hypothetical protein